MKISQYNQMMAYLTRPKLKVGGTVGSTPETKKLIELLNEIKPGDSFNQSDLSKKSGASRKLVGEYLKKLYPQLGRGTGTKDVGRKLGDRAKDAADVEYKKLLDEGFLEDYKKRIQSPRSAADPSLSNKALAKKYFPNLSEVAAIGRLERAASRIRKENPKLTYKKISPKEFQTKRKSRLLLTQGGKQFGGTDKFPFHHIMPIGGAETDITTKDVTFISKRMNSKLAPFNKKLNGIADGISNNLANYAGTKDAKFLKRVDDLNAQALQIVDKTKKKLPKKFQGLIGFNKVTPILDENATLINTSVERIGIDEAKSIVGKKGPKIPLKDLPGTRSKAALLQKIKNVSPQLNAKLPIISTMYDVAKTIPGDVGKAKYLSAGFKTLGLAVAPYVAYTTYQDIAAGKNLVEALERNIIGTDIIGGTKDILAMSPEEREARAKVKQEQITELNVDMPTGFGFIEAPPVQTDMSLEEAKQKFEAGKQRVAKERAEKEAGVAAVRKQAFDNLKDTVTGSRAMAVELAGGGLLKQAGVESGPPPEKGPTPQGLDFLLKRGRKS